MDSIDRHEQKLTQYALSRLDEVRGISIYGPKDPNHRGAVISFNVDTTHPHDVGQVLDSYGVATRAGHHCAQPLMQVLGVGSTVRASFYLYNSEDDVDKLITALDQAVSYFSN